MAPRHPRAYRQTSQQDFTVFYHEIMCCPTKRTLLQAIKDGYFSTWPGLTEKLISKYLPEQQITEKGHLYQQKQLPAAAALASVTPLYTKKGENTSEVLLQLFDPTENTYSDLTGQFPVQSDRGNNYILVSYHCKENNILTTPLKNRTGPWILSVITKICEKLRKLTPKIHIMDNEVSEDLKKYFEYSDIRFQLMPPHMYWRNAAERSVRTFKNHFIAALCTVDPLSPFYVWDRLLPQVTMTLNMLRQYRLNPGISAYEQVDGIHNFEGTPLSTLGLQDIDN